MATYKHVYANNISITGSAVFSTAPTISNITNAGLLTTNGSGLLTATTTNTAFNKSFGTTAGTILEGNRLDDSKSSGDTGYILSASEVDSRISTAVGGVPSSLATMSDVYLSGVLTDQVLSYDGSTWTNTDAPSTDKALNDITDLSITAASAGHVIKYTGSNWVNGALNHTNITDFDTEVDARISTVVSGIELNDLTDATITTPATDQVLKYNGSAWVNSSNIKVTEVKPVGGDLTIQSNNNTYGITIADTELTLFGTVTTTGAFHVGGELLVPQTSVVTAPIVRGCATCTNLRLRDYTNTGEITLNNSGVYEIKCLDLQIAAPMKVSSITAKTIILTIQSNNTANSITFNDTKATYAGTHDFTTATINGININDLTDATITTPVTDQVLTYNGSAWVNGSAAFDTASASLDDMEFLSQVTFAGNNETTADPIIKGSLLYYPSKGYWMIVDITDTSNPVILSETFIATNDWIGTISVRGSLVSVGTAAGRARLYDVSDPSLPDLLVSKDSGTTNWTSTALVGDKWLVIFGSGLAATYRLDDPNFPETGSVSSITTARVYISPELNKGVWYNDTVTGVIRHMDCSADSPVTTVVLGTDAKYVQAFSHVIRGNHLYFGTNFESAATAYRKYAIDGKNLTELDSYPIANALSATISGDGYVYGFSYDVNRLIRLVNTESLAETSINLSAVTGYPMGVGDGARWGTLLGDILFNSIRLDNDTIRNCFFRISGSKFPAITSGAINADSLNSLGNISGVDITGSTISASNGFFTRSPSVFDSTVVIDDARVDTVTAKATDLVVRSNNTTNSITFNDTAVTYTGAHNFVIPSACIRLKETGDPVYTNIPSFAWYIGGGNNTSGDDTCVDEYAPTGGVTTSGGNITVPAAGVYLVSMHMQFVNISSTVTNIKMTVTKNGSTEQNMFGYTDTSGVANGNAHIQVTRAVQLSAGDTIATRFDSVGGTSTSLQIKGYGLTVSRLHAL